MIKGMTGYGVAQLSSGKVKALVEIKSLNHRYFDVNYFLPLGFGSLEEKIRLMLRKEIDRGRITVSVRIQQKPQQTIALNKEAVRAHLKIAKSLTREFGLKNDISQSDIIRLPGVIETSESFVQPGDVWPVLEKSLQRALKSLMSMRRREGKSLNTNLCGLLRRMEQHQKKISVRTATILKDKRKVFTEEEFTSFQKSSDIGEELTRLQHYINELKLLLKSKVAVGKKIDFVAQEMQRETNTIGSKVQDKIISGSVIALKGKIEKIREQAQNIE